MVFDGVVGCVVVGFCYFDLLLRGVLFWILLSVGLLLKVLVVSFTLT